ncbi:hypothetical protein [Deinococcus hopiensis]|uniref:Uncharacterized protein n=1 Tax=Deinococcus hopiensis KR-140 TaxID=695939 RepID=A0A1W1UB44_9DEIO|nr:hypothetical protein [Deinococcus hopiensis]SMB78260.1 hypothetical protein SAMN00790413_06577 [Deinococcus hopiensis KR-140]
MHQADLDPDMLTHFGFMEDWVEAGLLTRHVLDALSAQWAQGGNPKLEHSRWSAFHQYMRGNPTLILAQFDCLWKLGRADADPAMGHAILCELVRRHDCPSVLLERVAVSRHGVLARKSCQVLASRPENLPGG